MSKQSQASATTALAVAAAALFLTPTASAATVCGGLSSSNSGSAADNVMKGSDGSNVFSGGAGNDVMFGFGGDDIFCGGPGDDTIYTGSGDDVVFGEDGSDTIKTASGDDEVTPGTPSASAEPSGSVDRVFTGGGGDTLELSPGGTIFGGNTFGFLGAGDDIASGSVANNTFVDGQGGEDQLGVFPRLAQVSLVLSGDAGSDYLQANTTGASTLQGGLGDDRMQSADTCYGGDTDGESTPNDRFLFCTFVH